MGVKAGLAALCAALCFSGSAFAQDVTLVAREGGIVLTGTLRGYDGEFYRIDTAYGALTVDGQGVICEGPACPDLIAPKAVMRIVGSPDAAGLLPALFLAFAQARGLIYETGEGEGYQARILDPESRKDLAEVSFTPMAPDLATAAVQDGAADLKLAFRAQPDLGSHSVAMDALVVLVAPDNPTPEISTIELAKILGGEVGNWAQIGGPDMPVVLHALAGETDLQRALGERLGTQATAAVLHNDLATLATAVAKDPWAVAISGRSAIAPARRMPLTDSCGFPLLPTPLAIKAEDYPLALPVLLLTPKRRLPLLTREFLDFLRTPAAQAAVAAAGFVDRSASRQPMTADGLRLLNAIKGAGEDVTLADLKRLAEIMDGADRVSLTFRFEDGSSTLDAQSQDNLADLAQLIAAGQFRNQKLVLAGFSDGSGAAGANLALSVERAAKVAQELAAVAPDLSPTDLPVVEGFGEALPMACDETAIGRQLNRRVELWVVPDFAPAEAPAP
ncbi:phosphate ABC transporter substrate-binding/OmpA family protein [Tabrizicola sp.]|uniref:phosphate ABC transporter substrate-binding/OmpA family protein n=1 Tax=Tabrizicola sp. TaxID=2005166 RepID=UPI00273453D9|nr:phosphate ABC transporter substrate-binding/OmpA family protein [Tabrizicola sp.]MDP3197475.1 phosphate ABC transporter substrate-binding/OmpA family protein [Tabrizicola sp.]